MYKNYTFQVLYFDSKEISHHEDFAEGEFHDIDGRHLRIAAGVLEIYRNGWEKATDIVNFYLYKNYLLDGNSHYYVVDGQIHTVCPPGYITVQSFFQERYRLIRCIKKTLHHKITEYINDAIKTNRTLHSYLQILEVKNQELAKRLRESS